MSVPRDLAELRALPLGAPARVVDLDQAAFEQLVAAHPALQAIELWKCPRITDLTPLERLPELELVSIYWNQRTTRLWDLTRTPRLRGLRIEDFTRLRCLDDLAAGSELTELVVGDAVDLTSVFETLEPLSVLTGLRSLDLSPKKVVDGRVEPLGALAGLDTIMFPANLFTTEQVAWLRARLPRATGRTLGPLMPLGRELELNDRPRDVLLIGRRKPFLHTVTDAARVTRHVADFNRLVASYTADPTLLPE